MRTSTIVAAALLLPALAAQAQDKSAPASFELSKAQLAKIQQINARYDSQVKAGFAGDDKTVAAMQAELKAIDAMKDPAGKKAAIAAYQAKYAKTYRTALAKGKVNLSAWAADLKAVTPGLNYTVKDGTHILATAKSTSGGDPAPTTTTKTLRASDFSFEKDLGCGAVAGAGVTQSGMNLTNDTWAAEVGGCLDYGTLTYKLTVPEGQSALVELGGDLSVDVWAVGVVAVASSAGSSAVHVINSERNYVVNEVVYCSAGAPFLWAAAASCALDNIRLSKRITAAGRYDVVAKTHTSSFAGGVVAATAATSKVRDLSAKIILEAR